jgi:hypothetical protein
MTLAIEIELIERHGAKLRLAMATPMLILPIERIYRPASPTTRR